MESAPSVETWHKLPPSPPDFPKYTTFELTREEAEFLCERIQFSNPKSLLASLTEHRQNGNAEDFIGDNMEIDDLKDAVLANGGFGDDRIELLSNAVMFSNVMYGAALVYNWQLAKLKNDIEQKHGNNEAEAAEDWVGYYEAKLDKWTQHLDLDEISEVIRGQNQLHSGSSSFSRFWQLTMDQGHTITQSTRRFVENWISMLLDGTVFRRNFQSAGELVRNREIELKKGKSRFENRRALKQWRGDSGLIPMNFRWYVARSYLKDLHEGLNSKDIG